MAGLAIDFGMLYNIKARLQTAVDAAAIGAGYLLHASTNVSDPTQLAAIQNAAQRYFNANYPTHYFGSTVASYTAVVSSSNSGRSITVNARATVPMLLMRVLRINASQVAAVAVSNVKYISMMLVVDRSASVVREGAAATIQSALSTFVATAGTSYLVDGVDTVGMVSFGGTWNLDYAPNIHFQTSSPNIQTAINNIPFNTTNSTNTAEGLYQGWTQLYQANLPGSLNVIVLLTDGRPTALTGNFQPASNSSCSNKSVRGGVMVTLGLLPYVWPPPSSPNLTSGLLATKYTTAATEPNSLAPNSQNCYYASTGTNIYRDFNSTFPTYVGPVDNVGPCGSKCVGGNWNPSYPYAAGVGISTQCCYYMGPGTNMTSPPSSRYSEFNAADNIATLIRKDTTLQPMIFVVGLNYTDPTEEPLDADWLANVANDPYYTTVGSDPVKAAGLSVYQAGQTPGMYCNSTPSTLNACFAQVTSQLLRLVQ